MIKVGVIGAGGYAGITLVQLILNHPTAEIVWVISETKHKGKNVVQHFPHLQGKLDLTYNTLEDLEDLIADVDVVFLALPHGIAMHHVPTIIAAGKKVIDLGADFRFSDLKVFKKWYGLDHQAKKELKEAIFGLPELYRQQIKEAPLIGNPGCYPTASILGLAPLVKSRSIKLDSIIIDAKSGISGAGRSASLKTHYCERNEGIEGYAVSNHRHMGEIEFQLSRLIDDDFKVTFVPHLSPMNRGILATIYAQLKSPMSEKELMDLYNKFYKSEPFVRILDDHLPNTKYVAGTNNCDIAICLNEGTGKVIVLSAIDNLVKGAAGQAVQNMNILFGVEETAGLKQIAVYP